MLFPQSTFDPETVALMGHAFDDAWQEIQTKNFFPSVADADEIRSVVARRIMAAVVDGERDPERLKTIAVRALET